MFNYILSLVPSFLYFHILYSWVKSFSWYGKHNEKYFLPNSRFRCAASPPSPTSGASTAPTKSTSSAGTNWRRWGTTYQRQGWTTGSRGSQSTTAARWCTGEEISHTKPSGCFFKKIVFQSWGEGPLEGSDALSRQPNMVLKNGKIKRLNSRHFP